MPKELDHSGAGVLGSCEPPAWLAPRYSRPKTGFHSTPGAVVICFLFERNTSKREKIHKPPPRGAQNKASETTFTSMRTVAEQNKAYWVLKYHTDRQYSGTPWELSRESYFTRWCLLRVFLGIGTAKTANHFC